MSEYKITCARGNVPYSTQMGTVYYPKEIPDPVEPDPPEYDQEMASAFGSNNKREWVLCHTNVVSDGDFYFWFFWTWKLQD